MHATYSGGWRQWPCAHFLCASLRWPAVPLALRTFFVRKSSRGQCLQACHTSLNFILYKLHKKALQGGLISLIHLITESL